MKKEKLKHGIRGYILGVLTMVLIFSCTIAFAVGGTTWTNVFSGGIKIVVDGKQIQPKDALGNSVEPVIYNGTTYLPVRAVADALGKSVYWDGPNYTVYLGNMGGTLGYPSIMLKDMTSISNQLKTAKKLTDNYGNNYGSAFYNRNSDYEYLLNMKYSSFKGTLYVPEGVTHDGSCTMIITVDGKEVYTSPAMNKTSQPVPFEVNVTGGNDFKISFSYNCGVWGESDSSMEVCVANAGFYQ